MKSDKNYNKIKLSKLIIHLVLILFTLFCVVPIILVVIISVMREKEIFTTGYTFFPKELTLAAYKQIFLNPKQLLTSYSITFLTTLVGTIVGLILTTSMGYVISRKDYRYRKFFSFYIFFTMLFNGGLVPTYIMIVSWFKMKDTFFALLFPYLCMPFYVILMRSFLQTIPSALIESAKIDGARELRIFIQIILPLSKPAIATVGLFIAFNYWNDWFQSMTYTTKINLFSLQYLLVSIMKNIEFLNSSAGRLMTGSTVDLPQYSARMAMCVMAAGPMLFIFPFFQKYFIKGLTIGSIKG
ncbi:MAG TPA: carbohydrate ABC transporter permease [Clostridiaceae bacterium]|nr:carbohydrate ABC transporter permease [Clostridiaceae bacterium]